MFNSLSELEKFCKEHICCDNVQDIEKDISDLKEMRDKWHAEVAAGRIAYDVSEDFFLDEEIYKMESLASEWRRLS